MLLHVVRDCLILYLCSVSNPLHPTLNVIAQDLGLMKHWHWNSSHVFLLRAWTWVVIIISLVWDDEASLTQPQTCEVTLHYRIGFVVVEADHCIDFSVYDQ